MQGIKHNVILFLICFILIFKLHSQTLRLTAGTVCTDGIVSVPVSAENMQNIYGFTMRLHYDNSVLTYTGYNVLNPQLYSTVVTADAGLGMVQMEKALDTSALNINGYMYVLNFNLTASANSLLIWDSAFFYGTGGALVPATLINGAVLVPPEITQQPVAQNICTNATDTVTFFLQTTDTLHQYQWQVSYNNGANWLALVPDLHYQGIQTKVLRIIHPELNMHNNQYRCKISGACTLYSDAALLEVRSNILLQPHDTVIDAGGTAIFSAVGTGSSPLYLWEISTDDGLSWSSDALFPAVTTPSITLVNPPLTWSGYLLRCIVSGLCAPPSDTTRMAALWIGNMGVASEADKLKMNLFPNPVCNRLNLTFETPFTSSITLNIYDVNGRILISQTLATNAGYNHQIIDTEGLSEGLYFISLSEDTGFSFYKKFVK